MKNVLNSQSNILIMVYCTIIIIHSYYICSYFINEAIYIILNDNGTMHCNIIILCIGIVGKYYRLMIMQANILYIAIAMCSI